MNQKGSGSRRSSGVVGLKLKPRRASKRKSLGGKNKEGLKLDSLSSSSTGGRKLAKRRPSQLPTLSVSAVEDLGPSHAVFKEPLPAEQVAPEHRFSFEAEAGDDSFIPYREQGDAEMYSRLALLARNALRRHPRLMKVYKRYWDCYTKDATGHVQYDEYVAVYVKMVKVTTPPAQFDQTVAQQLAANDWHRDTQGSSIGLDFPHLCDSLFELADIWTETIRVKDYVGFLENFFFRITKQVRMCVCM
jgi:hypothetical protein